MTNSNYCLSLYHQWCSGWAVPQSPVRHDAHHLDKTQYVLTYYPSCQCVTNEIQARCSGLHFKPCFVESLFFFSDIVCFVPLLLSLPPRWEEGHWSASEAVRLPSLQDQWEKGNPLYHRPLHQLCLLHDVAHEQSPSTLDQARRGNALPARWLKLDCWRRPEHFPVEH